MATATAKIDICNLTMDHLAQEAIITNIDTPGTEEEIKCARWYDVVRRSTLRAFPFTFARDRFVASRDVVNVPLFGYTDAYNLPNDYLKLSFFSLDDSSLGDIIPFYAVDFALEGRKILLNNSGATSINIGYIKDETDVTKFDALFVDLFAIELAARMSFSFTLKPSLKKLLMEERLLLKAEAKAVNSQERPPKRVERSKFIRARRSMLSNVASKFTIFDS